MIWILVVWFGVTWAYPAIMAARHSELTVFWKVNLFPLAVLGVICDFLFNVFGGSFMFVELPHEKLFSHRVQRHVNESSGYQLRLALWWKKQLNVFDAHIK